MQKREKKEKEKRKTKKCKKTLFISLYTFVLFVPLYIILTSIIWMK